MEFEPIAVVCYNVDVQSSFIKNKAAKLRKDGYSFKLISDKLGLAKSTLSNWFKDIPFTPNDLVLRRIKEGPLKSAQIRHNRKVESVLETREEAKKEMGRISKRDLWMVGIGLYLGEGSKLYESIRIINSDPDIIRIALKWFRGICGLKTKNITIALHLYPDNDIEESILYWSKSVHIPRKQFRKTQIDRRKDKRGNKNRKLPHGTAHLTVVSNNDPENGVKLHRRIMGWVEGVMDQV